MKLVVEPRSSECHGHRAPAILWTTEGDLGGVFYDYLRDSSRAIVGVRLHLMSKVSFGSHPVYGQFIHDSRFVFCAGEYVDMVAEERHADLLQQGLLSLDVVQDFDGVQVVKRPEGFAIVVDMQFV